jgi:single-stranded DNA-binding protein
MNEVYLRGKLVFVYEPIAPASQPKHLVYQLRVSHKTAQQQVKFENYTVNAWRNLAVWASSNLQVGMDVFVRGHLSQRQSSSGPMTEVTALTITPVMGRMATARVADGAAESTAASQSPSELEVCLCAEASDSSET